MSGFFVPQQVLAAGEVSILPATGGEAVSIDTSSASTATIFTELSGPTITENTPGSISAGTHMITLPAGWEFDITSTVTVHRTAGDILPVSQIVTPTTNSLTFNIANVSTINSSLAFIFNNMKVRPTGTTLTTNNITHSGSAITGVTDGSTSFGTLATVAGTVTKLAFTTEPGATTIYGSNLSAQPVVKTQDQFGNDSISGLAANKDVVLSLTSGTTGALFGTATLDIGAGNGTVAYIDLYVNEVGAGKQLTATADGLTLAVSSSFEITQKPLTATVVASPKEYDGNATAVITSANLLGLVYGDVITADIGTSATFFDSNAGTGKVVTATGITLNGAKAINYSFSETGAGTGTADITKKPITVTANTGQTKVYGENDLSFGYTFSLALIAGNSFSGALSRATGENFGDYAINLGTLSSGNNYLVTLDATLVNFSITKRPITVEASASSKEYDGTTTSAGIPVITVGTLATGDTGNFIETYADPNVTPSGTNELTASGTAGGNSGNNYSYTFPHTMNGIITKKPLAVSGLSATNKPYDGNTSAVITGTPVLVGIVNNEVISLAGTAVGTFNTKNVGSNTVAVSGLTLNATDAVKANYFLTQPTPNATISPLEITITPDASQTKVYGQIDPVYTYSFAPALIDSSFSGALSRVANENVGTYTYTLGDLSAGANYHLNLGDGPSEPSLGAVNLGTAGNFAILSKAGITTTGVTHITGDIGVSPIGYAAMTGFTLIPTVPNGSNTFSTSALVTGEAYAADYTDPTPANLGVSVLNMQAAYTDALSRPTGLNLLNKGNGVGEIGGLTLSPGVYTFTVDSINVLISTNLTLNGSANDVWIFQIPGTLNIASGAKVLLTGGALAKNVFWAVAGATTLGTYSTFNGNILAATNIAMQTGAVLNGRALAQTAVTLDANTVTIPPSGLSASTFVITPKLLTVTATGIDKKYNRTTDATVTLLDDKIPLDDVTLGHTAAFTDWNVGIGKTVNVTNISITGGVNAGNYTLGGITATTTTANITKAPLTATITVAPKIYDGNDSATILTSILNEGVISGDIVTLNGNGAATFDNKNVGVSKAISTSGIALGGADAGNYSLTQPSLSNGAITPKTLTVTATGVNKVYNANTTATVNLSSDKLSGDTLTLAYTTATFVDKNVADNKSVSVSGISISGTDAGNYTLANTTAATTADITKAPLTATITVANKVYDGNNSATITGHTLVGKIGSDDIALSGGTAIFANADVGNNKPVSATSITIAGADIGNYAYNSAATGIGNILPIPTVVYVDDNWVGTTLWADPDNTGPATAFDYDAFSTIQGGINAVAVGGTVNVVAGLYQERIIINKSLALLGATESVSKKNYIVPASYAYDANTESIIKPATDAQVPVIDVEKLGGGDIVGPITIKGFVLTDQGALIGSMYTPNNNANRGLINLNIYTGLPDGILIENNVIGPHTGPSQNGLMGRGGITSEGPSNKSRANMVIKDNLIFDNLGDGVGVMLVGAYLAQGSMQNYSGSRIENNMISGNTRSGIEIAGGVNGSVGAPFIISNNTIKDSGWKIAYGATYATNLKYGNGINFIRGGGETDAQNNGSVSGVPLYPFSSPTYVSITSNEIINNEKNGIYMGPMPQHITVTGNTIQSNGTGGSSYQIWDGIRIDLEENYYGVPGARPYTLPLVLDKFSDNVFNSNTIAGNGSKGVKVINTSTLGPVSATKNWWNTIDGTTIASLVSGNVNYRPWRGSNDLTSSVDETHPSVTISSSAGLLTKTSPIPFSVTFGTGETVYDFTAADITVTNGVAGEPVVSGNAYTFNVTPNTGVNEGDITVNIATDVAWDKDGNYNIAAQQFSIHYDHVAPTLSSVSISSSNTNQSLAKVDNTITLNFTANEAIQAPTVAIATHSVTATYGSGNSWTAIYTMQNIDTETVNPIAFTIDFSDLAGNPGTKVTEVTSGGGSVTFDKTAPVVAITSIAGNNFINDSEKSAVVVIGTAEANALVNVTLSDGIHSVLGSQQLTGNNTNFSITLDGSSLSDGVITPSVTAKDATGNISEPITTPTATKDIITPSVVESSLLPVKNAIGVALDATISLAFSEKVSIGSVVVKNNTTNVETTISGNGISFNNTTNTATITLPTGTLQSNTLYTAQANNVQDEAGNSIVGYGSDNYWNFTTATGYSINLTSGWNLISLPVTPATWRSIPDTLASVSGRVNRIWMYDAPNGKWLVYNTDLNVPSDTNFTSLEAGKGYWVEMNTSGTLVGSGTLYEQLVPSGGQPSDQLPQVQLAEGWNLIGYYQLPGKTFAPIIHALSKLAGAWSGLASDIITFAPNTLSVQTPIGTMDPGKGYWIYIDTAKLYSFGDGEF